MDPSTPLDGALATAVGAALAPYPWRRFTPELMARLALAASDRHRLHEALASVPGADVGGWDGLEPAARGDARVGPLVELLASHRWTEASLPHLCRRLGEALRS